MTTFRKLRADEIECKVGSVSPKGASLLLYKTARTDMDLLDETYGAENWKCEYQEIKGNLYCTIYIWSESKKEWVAKQDCGVESAFGDKEKGEASDAFKRAGFKVGIGRELYTAPFIWVSEYDKEKDKFTKYEVKSIGYDEAGNINQLDIISTKDKHMVFSFGKKTAPVKKELSLDEKNAIEMINGATEVTELRRIWADLSHEVKQSKAVESAKEKKKGELIE